MPKNALAAVKIDYKLPANQMGAVLVKLAEQRAKKHVLAIS